MEHPEPAALKKVSADLVTRHGIFPLALEKQTLHLAMSDPRNPDQVDDSAFATGLHIQPYVISELRLTELLERHYRIRRETRYNDVGSELGHGRHASGAPHETPASGSVGIAADECEGVVDPLGADQELIDGEAFTALQADWQNMQMGMAGEGGPASLPEPPPPTSEAMPKTTPTRTDASVQTDSSVADDVAARLQAEPDPRGAALAAVTLESALVLPIAVRQRVINLLYVDNEGEPLAETAVAALCALGGCVSQAYERLIVERKARFT